MGPILGTEKQRLHRSVCADLAQLINTIRLVSSGGDYGINKDAEDLFCGFLNIVLDCEYPGIQLKNLNMLQDGYPSIDLGDADKKVAVQVTTTEHREKIAHTLKLFFQNKLNQTYDRLIVLIIGKKDSSKKAFLVQDDFRFSAQEDIWDIDRIGVVLGKLSEKKLEEITDYFSQKLYTKQTGALERDKQMLFSEELSAVMAEIRKLRESIAQFPGSRIEDRAEEKQAILRRIHDAPRMVEKIVEPIIYAHDHGMGNGSDGIKNYLKYEKIAVIKNKQTERLIDLSETYDLHPYGEYGDDKSLMKFTFRG